MTISRRATLARKTKETDVQITLDLDGRGAHRVQTGVPFLDHMLAHVAVHGLLDLDVVARGDLEVDAHHTVEDVAIVLGEALDRALGPEGRAGIQRIGFSYVPMDEALARVVVDLSGRGYAVVQAEFRAPMLGTMPSTLVAHFFETLAGRARLTLHAQVLYGRDDHHQAEALFKALGRALGLAVARDARREVTSTKGTL